MSDFQGLLEQVKLLFESGLYEDVKVLADMLLAWSDCPPLSSSTIASATASVSSYNMIDEPTQAASSSPSSYLVSTLDF